MRGNLKEAKKIRDDAKSIHEHISRMDCTDEQKIIALIVVVGMYEKKMNLQLLKDNPFNKKSKLLSKLGI